MTEWRAITVREPWASAIVDRHKPTENRGKNFPRGYRGMVLIHSAKVWSERGEFDDRINRAYPRLADHRGAREKPAPFFLGAYIGAARLIDVHVANPVCCTDEWAEQTYMRSDDHLQREVAHLVFDRARRFRYPMFAQGRLGLWKPTPQELALLPL